MIINLITIILFQQLSFAQDATNPNWDTQGSNDSNNSQSFVYETDELGRTVKKTMIQIAQVVQQENSKYKKCKKKTKCGACCKLFYDKTTQGIQQGFAYVSSVVELENTYCQSSATECNHSTSEGLEAHFDQAKAELKKNGPDISNSIVDVSTLKTSGNGSQIAKALSGAGVSQADIKVTQEIDAEKDKSSMKKIAEKISNLFDGGAFSGKSNSKSSAKADDEKDMSFSNKNKTGKNSLSQKNKVKIDPAGYSKDYFGDPIGIAQDDLFKMIARRYKSKEGQAFFFSK